MSHVAVVVVPLLENFVIVPGPITEEGATRSSCRATSLGNKTRNRIRPDRYKQGPDSGWPDLPPVHSSSGLSVNIPASPGPIIVSSTRRE